MLKETLPPQTRQMLEMQGQGDPTRFFGSQEMYIILGVSLLLAGLLFVWAFYIRKPKSRSRGRRIITRPAEISRSPREHQKRTKKRRWKYRNPTLSETGGLPPRKSGNASPDVG